MVLFDNGTRENKWADWVESFHDFGDWLAREQRKCVPRGPCGQSHRTTSGLDGLTRRYPTFEDAYAAYKSEVSL